MNKTLYLVSIALLCTALSCAGVTIVQGNGKQVVGDVVAKDDTNLVLKTKTGQSTIPWRTVSVATLKALHPELYVRLKAQADERAKVKTARQNEQEAEQLANGMVKVGGKMMTPAAAALKKLQRVGLEVTSREVSKVTSRQTDRSSYGTYRNKDISTKNWGEVTVKLEGLEAKETHTLKIALIHYRDALHTSYSSSSSDSTTKFELNKEETITDKSEATLVFTTDEYNRNKSSTFSSYSGASKYESGYKSDGFDFSIWLDGTLVFEQKKGDPPVYHQVEKR